jgi:hypothetical protein
MTVVPHPTYFSLFLRLKIKLKDLHFDTIELLEAELRAALNTHTEHDLHIAFKKKWQKCWERCILAEVDYFEGDWPVVPKLVFDQMAAPVPEIMDASLCNVTILARWAVA